MTDLLDRTADRTAFDVAVVDELPPQPARPRPFVASQDTMRLAAALSVGAGVIHLVMVPSHAGESAAEGIGFAVTGWCQLVTAWLMLRRPSRFFLLAVAAANAMFIGAWVWSRTAGLPFGAHAGHAESVGFVDLTTVGFEAALVVCCLWPRGGLVMRRVAGIAIIGVFALATAAIASPSARDHAAHSHGDHTTVEAGAATHDHAAETAVDDKGLSALSNGHHHVIGAEQPLDRATRTELTREIAITQQVAQLYPTIAAAEAAGYRRAGPYSPGLGTHYIRPSGEGLNPDGVMDDADLLSPLALIYAGTDADAPIAGFMYYSMSSAEPAGFAGPNDHWHYHTNACIKPNPAGGVDAPFGADTDVPAAVCEQAGGMLLEQTQWMVHVWSVPGWESQQGLFGEVNPALTCSDGTYYELPLEEWITHPLNVCLSDA